MKIIDRLIDRMLSSALERRYRIEGDLVYSDRLLTSDPERSELAPEVCRAHVDADCTVCDENDDDLWVHPRDLPEEVTVIDKFEDAWERKIDSRRDQRMHVYQVYDQATDAYTAWAAEDERGAIAQYVNQNPLDLSVSQIWPEPHPVEGDDVQRFPLEDWRKEVANGGTRGYAEWLAAQLTIDFNGV